MILGNHEYRFGPTPGWTQTTVNGLNYYWVRLRLVAPITTAPIMQRIRLHTNTTVIGTDGYLQRFGTARVRRRTPDLFATTFEKTGKDQTVSVSSSLAMKGGKYKFENGQLDTISFATPLPFDMDTSHPVRLEMSYITSSADTNNVDWTLRVAYSTVYADSAVLGLAGTPAVAPGEVNNPAATLSEAQVGVVNAMQLLRMEFDVSSMVPVRDTGEGDTMWITLERDGAADGHAGHTTAYTMALSYVAWNDGGFIG